MGLGNANFNWFMGICIVVLLVTTLWVWYSSPRRRLRRSRGVEPVSRKTLDALNARERSII